eukprot:scaffold76792_cov75-Phaeocystis_antarctica.AAC.1
MNSGGASTVLRRLLPGGEARAWRALRRRHRVSASAATLSSARVASVHSVVEIAEGPLEALRMGVSSAAAGPQAELPHDASCWIRVYVCLASRE